MKGDFSRVRYAPSHNFNGILPQQGKVLLDSDGIAQTLIENDWHETAARDWVGSEACVPAAEPDSFAVTAASLTGGVVSLTLGTGHIWADGLLARLESASATSVTRTATWLEPPIVPTAGSAADVADGTMDAVVLELWQHAVSGFQMPDVLIEPALGGPDTAERLQTSFAFRLARLGAGQTCSDLTYDESGRGALTVSLVPAVTTAGDCPTVGSGGYSGFEHQLYRIEIADTGGVTSQFKWSRLNGGLVGRGTFDPPTQKISITASLPAITGVNQTSFYLEIETYDPALGYSHVTAGATVTLSGNTLQCPAAPAFGTYPSASGTVFFRLWDGIQPVSSFPISATPLQLESGILLQFDADAAGKYFPGDYWMFPVRAQGIPNPQVLINARKPEGIVYHRVPIAEITWASAGGGNFSAGTIEDCRNIVPPLSRNRGCCTCRVGDGIHSFGDFTSIQAAIDSLPAQGGEVCILPGRYFERVLISRCRDIVIHGCGWDSRVCSPGAVPVPVAAGAAAGSAINPLSAVITIVNSEHIILRDFVVEAADGDVGILIDGTGTSVAGNVVAATKVEVARRVGVTDVTVENMTLTASTLPAILAVQVLLLAIENNRVAMKNVRSLWPAIFTSGTEIHIEKNWVGIQNSLSVREWLPGIVLSDLLSPSVSSSAASAPAPAAASATSAKVMEPVVRSFVDASGLLYSSVTVAVHPGGIQIGGPSTDVYILENEIEGGSFNGITLGSLTLLDGNGNDTGTWIGIIIIDNGCCTGTITITGTDPNNPGGSIVAGGILTNIHIHRNRIRNMGMCGIGPVGFFDLATMLEAITIVGLNITHNSISRTLLRDLELFAAKSAGYIAHGAICVPDVLNLVICDNAITDFGPQPGADVCGIYVLHGEMIEISRNQVLETRDWSAASERAASTGTRGGIVIAFGTSPTFPQPLNASLWSVDAARTATPIYEPGLPAVRIEHNVVRVPLNYALEIIGLGPFSIVNNHLACGGLVASTGTQLAQTVLILNLGTAIDGATTVTSATNLYKNSQTSAAKIGTTGFREVSNGTVLFTNNICQLETSASGQLEIASVYILALDSLIFSNNHCWLDASRISALADAVLLAHTLNVVSNRFHEPLGSVFFSGITVGSANVAGQNISTNCLIVLGNPGIDNNNIVLNGTTAICSRLWAAVAKSLGI